MNSKERIELFKREISYISDENFKNFVKLLLENADDYFFSVAASSTGKHHPLYALGDGGLVRHTRAVTFFVNEILRPEMEFGIVDRHIGDLLIVSAIAHDIKKMGDGEEHTRNDHPQLAAAFIEKVNEENGNPIGEKDLEFICNVVRKHMGPWSEEKPSSRYELIVFYADYFASRRDVDVKFISEGVNIEVEPVMPEVKPIYTIEEYKFTFGKVKGLTLEEAYSTNPGFLKWMVRQPDFSFKEAQELVKEFLAQKENKLF